MPRHQQSPGGSGVFVASSRRDDRSGLLDIRALSSVIDAQRHGGASASSVAMPTFASTWALHDVPATLPPPPATAAPRMVAALPDHRPLYAMIGALSLAVLSLGVFVALRPSPTVVVERTAAAVPAAVVDEPESEPEPEPSEPAPAGLEGKPHAITPEAALPEAAELEPAPTSVARTSRKPHAKPVTKPAAEPVTKPNSSAILPVECVIDPSRCSNGKLRTKPTVEDPPSKAGLPAAPSSLQIREAMSSVRPQAKACAAKHSGRVGDKVSVKLSVQGSTGKVTSATALDDHAGTPLGRCVADALAKATLPRFAKPQAGVVYSVTM